MPPKSLISLFDTSASQLYRFYIHVFLPLSRINFIKIKKQYHIRSHNRRLSILGNSIFEQVNASNMADDTYFKKNCLCLPSCNDLTYNFEITEMKKNGTHIKNLNTIFSANHK